MRATLLVTSMGSLVVPPQIILIFTDKESDTQTVIEAPRCQQWEQRFPDSAVDAVEDGDCGARTLGDSQNVRPQAGGEGVSAVGVTFQWDTRAARPV